MSQVAGKQRRRVSSAAKWCGRAVQALLVTAGLCGIDRAIACDASKTYRPGHIVKITTESRAETVLGGPQPARQEDGMPAQSSAIDYGTVTHLRLRSGAQIYNGRMAAAIDARSLAEFAPGRSVRFRLSTGKLHLCRATGMDVEFTLTRK
jgi:hypothetical protein